MTDRQKRLYDQICELWVQLSDCIDAGMAESSSGFAAALEDVVKDIPGGSVSTLKSIDGTVSVYYAEANGISFIYDGMLDCRELTRALNR